MHTKLQELTDKIYNEGVQKANEEAGQILEKAKKEAEEIVAKARADAEKTIKDAEKKAEEIKHNMEAEMKLASTQALTALKQKVSGLITLQVVEPSMKEVFSDKDYLQKIIETVVKGWTKTGDFDLSVVLPEKDKKEFDKFFKNSLAVELNKGVEVSYDSEVEGGFRIGPKDGSYIISFTEEDFNNFFKAYLRPKTVELLFDKK
ncbi:MAG: V-type ATP synthase subunit E [Chlorobi bacterium]|nr:V-type ATP synthase subunit E [Chlorobiota bacterium]